MEGIGTIENRVRDLPGCLKRFTLQWMWRITDQKNLLVTSVVGALVAVLMTAPHLYAYVGSGGVSPDVFSDWDEPFYLPQVLAAGKVPLASLFSWEQGRLAVYWAIDVGIPHVAVDVIFGHLAALFRLSAAQLAILLDFFCSWFSYVAFVAFFGWFGMQDWRSHVATVALLVLPWLSALSFLVGTTLTGFAEVSAWGHHLHPCPPVLRALYTQVSYPLFALTLLLGVSSALLNARYSRTRALSAGLCCGLLLQVYFFAWASVLGVLGMFYLVLLLLPQGIRPAARRLFVLEGLFLVGGLVTAFPGLSRLFQIYGWFQRPAATAPTVPLSPPEFSVSEVWYFSPESVALLVLFLLYLVRFRRYSREFSPKQSILALLACFIVGVISTNFVLMNLPKILGQHMAAYHFPLFYLDPLLTGTLVLFTLIWGSQLLRRGVGTTIVLAACAMLGARFVRGIEAPAVRIEEQELIRYLRDEVPSESQVALIPFEHVFTSPGKPFTYLLLPYWIQSLSAQQIVFYFVGHSGVGAVERELALGWWYTGERRLLGPCEVSLKGDKAVVHDMVARDQFLRAQDCKRKDEVASSLNTCEVIRRYPVQFLVWQDSFGFVAPDWHTEVLTLRWKSSSETYKVYEVDQISLLQSFCVERDDLG